jgi:hypothetical protein
MRRRRICEPDSHAPIKYLIIDYFLLSACAMIYVNRQSDSEPSGGSTGSPQSGPGIISVVSAKTARIYS